MALVPMFVLIFFLAKPSQSIQACSNIDGITGVEKGLMLPNTQMTNLTVPGIMTCSRACLFRRRCKSFNFNIDTGECQLNSRSNVPTSPQLRNIDSFVFSDISHWPERLAGPCAHHTCPHNSRCDPVNATHHVCKLSFCLDTPIVQNGHVSVTPDVSLIGTVLSLICDPGFIPSGEVVCQNSGTWSSSDCVSISNCSMVKQYQPDSEDGEYWLRLTNFDNYTSRFYCHKMSTTSPTEFLTLQYPNYGIYPRVMNENCTGETELMYDCEGEGGEIWFYKIRVNMLKMRVYKGDKTFTSSTHRRNKFRYGVAKDCYTRHPNSEIRCGSKGKFMIDLRGTGWRVSDDTKWKLTDHFSIIELIDRQMNGTVINIQCGGFPGGCYPVSSDFFLLPFPENVANVT